jgi:hypothetical protein
MIRDAKPRLGPETVTVSGSGVEADLTRAARSNMTMLRIIFDVVRFNYLGTMSTNQPEKIH